MITEAAAVVPAASPFFTAFLASSPSGPPRRRPNRQRWRAETGLESSTRTPKGEAQRQLAMWLGAGSSFANACSKLYEATREHAARGPATVARGADCCWGAWASGTRTGAEGYALWHTPDWSSRRRKVELEGRESHRYRSSSGIGFPYCACSSLAETSSSYKASGYRQFSSSRRNSRQHDIQALGGGCGEQGGSAGLATITLLSFSGAKVFRLPALGRRGAFVGRWKESKRSSSAFDRKLGRECSRKGKVGRGSCVVVFAVGSRKFSASGDANDSDGREGAESVVHQQLAAAMAAAEAGIFALASGAMRDMHVVVCGAGVIGCATAYFLTKRGVRVTVVDRLGIAASASGKAGGFLALDWCDGNELGGLARPSFYLHEKLSKELGIDYGYRRLDTLNVAALEGVNGATYRAREGVATGRGARPTAKQPPSGASVVRNAPPDWLDGDGIAQVRKLGTVKNTGQVHPELFTKALMTRALEQGATLRLGEVQSLSLCQAGDGKKGQRLHGVVMDGELIEADSVVVALGPWSSRLVAGMASTMEKAHSVILSPSDSKRITPHALFTSIRSVRNPDSEPEIYPRPDGTVYVCGQTVSRPVPDNPAEVLPEQGACERLRDVAALISSDLKDSKVVKRQACFLPISKDGLPLIGRIRGVSGVYVGTGHSCWGILNGPATGAALAELIVDGVSEIVNLDPFDPSRFDPVMDRQQDRTPV